jgi:hypothetical protein
MSSSSAPTRLSSALTRSTQLVYIPESYKVYANQTLRHCILISNECHLFKKKKKNQIKFGKVFSNIFSWASPWRIFVSLMSQKVASTMTWKISFGDFHQDSSRCKLYIYIYIYIRLPMALIIYSIDTVMRALTN